MDKYIFHRSADVVVVGGGPSGITAAVASARGGAKTILLERYGFLGGNATAGQVGRFWGLYYKDKQIVYGIGNDFLNHLKEHGGLAEPNDFMPVEGDVGIDLVVRVVSHDPEILKCAADEFVLAEGVEPIFHAQCTGIVEEAGEIKAIEVHTPEGMGLIKAKVFVDTTGDGSLSVMAGAADMNTGNDMLQPPSMPFCVSNVDMEAFQSLTREEKQAIIKKGIDAGILTTVVFGGSVTPHKGAPGVMRIMMTRIPNVNAVKTADLTKAELAGRRQVMRVMDFLRREVPGFANANMVQIAPHLAVRETRRILGETVLSGEDAAAGKRPDSTVALATGPIDMHNRGTGFTFMQWPEQPFGIPYGALLPKNTKNVIMAGRCVSADRMANAGIRHMGVCFAMGHAAGAAAALSAVQNISLRDLSVSVLKETLIRENANLGQK